MPFFKKLFVLPCLIPIHKHTCNNFGNVFDYSNSSWYCLSETHSDFVFQENYLLIFYNLKFHPYGVYKPFAPSIQVHCLLPWQLYFEQVILAGVGENSTEVRITNATVFRSIPTLFLHEIYTHCQMDLGISCISCVMCQVSCVTCHILFVGCHNVKVWGVTALVLTSVRELKTLSFLAPSSLLP